MAGVHGGAPLHQDKHYPPLGRNEEGLLSGGLRRFSIWTIEVVGYLERISEVFLQFLKKILYLHQKHKSVNGCVNEF